MQQIYLQDRERLLFLNGISGAPGGFGGLVSLLRDRMEQRGLPRVITIGTSAGGYGALKYGLALGADRILGFSSPTSLIPALLDSWGDGRSKLVQRRLVMNFEQEVLDLNADVERLGAPGQIRLYYGSDITVDLHHAQHLSNNAAVTLHPVAGLSQHLSLDSAIVNGSFEKR